LVAEYQRSLQPVTDEIAQFMGYANAKAVYDSWEPAAISQYMVDGKIYAAIWDTNYFVWIINKNRFKAAGLDPDRDYPKTWEDLINVGKKLTQWENGRIIRHAVTFPYTRGPIWYFMELQPILLELGGDILNKEGTECIINSPEGIKAMELIKRRFTEGVTDKDISASEDYRVAFSNGDTAMGICSVIGWADSYEKGNPDLKGNTKLIPNPSFPGVTPVHAASTWAHSVNIKSDFKEWSWLLIDYLTKDPNSALLNGDTLIPRRGGQNTEGGSKLRDSELVAEAVKNSFASGSLRYFDQIGPPIMRGMQRILYENADIKAELDRVKVEVDRVIK
jgi:multiple sugar transport system substrate-binding protein